MQVWRRLAAKGEKLDLVIGSDTIVAHAGLILEKPRDETHAVEMLKGMVAFPPPITPRCAQTGVFLQRQTLPLSAGRVPQARRPNHASRLRHRPIGLSGTSHEVFSGVALLYPTQGFTDPSECCFVEMTKVNFAPLDDATIRAYVASGEPMDKAGGYGIQVQHPPRHFTAALITVAAFGVEVASKTGFGEDFHHEGLIIETDSRRCARRRWAGAL